jgi:dTDP-4-dehydrorhamnose reductase
LFGASGQLGAAIVPSAREREVELVSADRSIDVADARAVQALVEAVRPDWVINCAAMTDVDGAHTDPQRAFAVNALGPGNMARAAESVGARVVQISTEAVFDGERTAPYREDDACRPVSVYGAAKLAGESLVAIYSPESFILRTSWLYSGTTGMNFPTRLLQQLDDPDRSISVVTDVVGNPTPTSVLADAVMALVSRPPAAGTYHVCCLDPASKYEWAVEIARSAGHDPARIRQVTSDDYPTVALRPKHVDLSCEKFLATGTMVLPTWQEAWRGLTSEATR